MSAMQRSCNRCPASFCMLLYRFSQIDKPAVRIQISAQHQQNAKQKRFAMQMANRQLVVPSVRNKQQMQQVNVSTNLI